MDPYERIAELEVKLKDALAEVADLSRDCVSGLLGRSSFEKHLNALCVQNRRNDRPAGVIMCDIDHFKLVNDSHGHRIGDEVIAQVAQHIRSCTRTTDIVARYGGEEFVCLIQGEGEAGLALLAERIRLAVEALNVSGLPQVTISVGYALQVPEDIDGWDLVKRADHALYRAKHRGRNRTEGVILGHEEISMVYHIEQLRQQ